METPPRTNSPRTIPRTEDECNKRCIELLDEKRSWILRLRENSEKRDTKERYIPEMDLGRCRCGYPETPRIDALQGQVEPEARYAVDKSSAELLRKEIDHTWEHYYWTEIPKLEDEIAQTKKLVLASEFEERAVKVKRNDA